MSKTDPLFDLIKSMSKAEKIYFKRENADYEREEHTNNYILLFDALDKQKTYDEEKLRKKFEGEKFIDNLASTKNYLYQLILKSLGNYHQPKATHWLNQISVLYKRKLYEQCIKLIKKAKIHCKKNERYNELYRIGAFEYNLESFLVKKDELKQKEQIHQERSHYLQLLQNELYIYNCSNKLLSAIKLKEARQDDKINKNINTIYQRIIAFQPQLSTQTSAFKLFYYGCLSYYHVCIDQPQQALHYAYERIQIWEDFPDHQRYGRDSLLLLIKGYLNRAWELMDMARIEAYLPKLQQLVKKHPKIKDRSLYLYYAFGISVYIHQNKYALAQPLVQQLLKDLAFLEKKRPLQDIIFIYLILQHYYFGIADYDQALDWNHKILDCKSIYLIEQYIIPARLFSLIIHFELENYFLIPNLSISVTRYLNKLKDDYPLEKEFALRINKISGFATQKELKTLLEQLVNNLKELDKTDALNTHECFIFKPFIWVQSKIQQTNYAALLAQSIT